MALERLQFQNLRNLATVDMAPGKGVNLVSGANGSGKSSLLEGIHVLGLARSFRTHKLKHAIAHDTAGMTLFGRLAGDPPRPLGVRRDQAADGLEMRLDGEKVERVAQLAQALPLQLINPDAFRLLEGSPSARREFLDWGVFHVKHDFFDVWRRVRRALKHRNALLRHGKMDVQALNVWDREFAHWSERLDALRMEYMQALAPLFQATLAELIDLPELTLRYQRGWDAKRPLGDVLAAGRDSDSHMGFTQTGPQRADLRIRMGRRPAVEVLSRGQQKLVVSALKLAQGRLLEEMNGRTCVYLIDDLPAELDGEHRRLFCQLLAGLECQVFVTCVEPETLDRVWLPNTDVRMFHVEHGRLHTE